MWLHCARVVRRFLWMSLLFALFCAPSAFAQTGEPTLLMPGVTYTKRVQFTPHGPVVLNVVTAPKPGGPYSLFPALSNDSILGREAHGHGEAPRRDVHRRR